MSEPTKCGFCEEPVPADRTDGFCDDQCKDLAGRARKPEPRKHRGHWNGPKAGKGREPK